MATKVGTVMEVLFEDLKPNGEIMGFTDNYCPVFVKGSDELLGQFVKVKIISNSRTSLKGEILCLNQLIFQYHYNLTSSHNFLQPAVSPLKLPS